MPPTIRDERAAFDVPDDVAYFNTASLAPQLHAVRAAGEAALEQRARPWAIAGSDWFSDVERLRGLFGRIVGAGPDGVAIIPATSYGFAVAARSLSLRAGQHVLVLDDEYPSGIYTWRAAVRRADAAIRTVAREPGQSWADAVLAAADERVAIISVPNVHWTDGSLVELAPIAARARELGARLVIDGSQSVGVMPLDVAELRPDFLITVGYKWLLGPFAVGYLYVAEDHRDGEPLEENWIGRAGSEDFDRLVDYTDEYQPGARRFDVGQRTHFELTPMAIAALEQVLAWGVEEIGATLARRTADIARHAAGLGLEPAPEDRRGPHLLGVRLPEQARSRIVAALEEQRCFAALRAGVLRISSHLHVTDGDVRRLADGLGAAL